MKKIIMCILLVIPIIVILTIDASGRLIASALVDIQAETITLKHEGEAIVSDEIKLEDYVGTNKRYTLFAEIFPGIATTELVWASSDESIATVSASVKEGGSNITFKDYGSVDITCTSVGNSSVYARVTIYVSGDTLGYIVIGEYNSAAEQDSDIVMPLYSQKALYGSVKPARALGTAKINWSSSNPNTVSVDNNGVITAMSAGEANITAGVMKGGVTVEKTVKVTVSGSALLTRSRIYTNADSVDVSQYFAVANVTSSVADNVALMSALSVGQEKTVTVTNGSDTETLVIVKTSTDRALAISNIGMLNAGVLSGCIALGSANIELGAYAAVEGYTNEQPEIIWSSSDESVLYINNGRIYAVGGGIATITASAAGFESASIAVEVTTPIEDFRLSEAAYKDKAGLMQERMFGNLTYINGNFSNTFQISVVSKLPANANSSAITFESANRAVATVTKSGLVTFAADCEGKSVTITATAYNSEGMAVRYSYTFNLVNGVNIGTNINIINFDKQAGEEPTYQPYYDLLAVIEDGRAKSVVLHCDVYYPSQSKGGASINNMMMVLYGNGRKVDGQFFSAAPYDILFTYDFTDGTYLDSGNYEVGFINVNLQATKPTSDESEAAFTEMVATGGGAVTVKGAYADSKSVHFNFRFCLFQYAYSHLDISNGEVSIEGCVFRNNSATGITYQQCPDSVANITIKNCIFSNTIAPVAMVCGSLDAVLEKFSGGADKPLKFGTLTFEGQNYIYNWKIIDEIRMDMLPDNVDDEAFRTLVRTANDKLSQIIREAFQLRINKKHLYKDTENAEWLNFGFLVIGAWSNISPQINTIAVNTDIGVTILFDKNYYSMSEVSLTQVPMLRNALFKAVMNGIGINLEANKTYLLHAQNSDGEWNTRPGETYNLNAATYARLHGSVSVSAAE